MGAGDRPMLAWLAVLALALATVLSGCGGGGYGGGDGGGRATYDVTAMVTGLKSTLVLQDGAGNDIQIAASGPVTLARSLTNGASYDFTVKRLPANPPQSCAVARGGGVINGANVTDIRIDCIDALTVTMKSPADNATNVSLTQPLVLTFSAPLDERTLSSTAFHFGLAPDAANPGEVPLTLVVTGNQLTLTPMRALQPNASYLLAVMTTAVRGTGGEPLLATIVTSFRTADQVAGTENRLRFAAALDGASFPPVARLAANSQGSALVAWNQFGAHGQVNVWASRYESAAGWSAPELIDPDDTRSARNPDIAADGDGNALAAWERVDGTCANIFANRYIVGAGWGAPVLIEPTHCDARGAHIAVGPAGDAIAVWYQFTAGSAHIWANRFVPGAGWGTVERIDNVAGNAAVPQIAIDRNGNALAMWEQFDGTRKSIWANRYVIGTGWGSARRIESNDASDAQGVQLTVDAVGNALAVWQQADGPHERIWANSYRADGDWGTAAVIGGTDVGDASRPQIAIRNGSGFAIWQLSAGTRTAIFARRYEAGSFSDAVFVLSDSISSASFPQVAVDSQGNAIAVWGQKNAPPLINQDAVYGATMSSFTPADGGWSFPRSIETPNEGGLDEIHPQLAIGANDLAFTAWDHLNSAGTSIWAKHLN
jgi:hypothetical protein